MIPSNRTATHPGEVLRDEFLAEMGIFQTELAASAFQAVSRRSSAIANCSILGEFLTSQKVGLLSCQRERVEYVDAGADDILHVTREQRKVVAHPVGASRNQASGCTRPVPQFRHHHHEL
jgi:RNase P/RNase MRP subunit POP5